jgi:hypothetical protein
MGRKGVDVGVFRRKRGRGEAGQIRCRMSKHMDFSKQAFNATLLYMTYPTPTAYVSFLEKIHVNASHPRPQRCSRASP